MNVGRPTVTAVTADPCVPHCDVGENAEGEEGKKLIKEAVKKVCL